MVFWKRFISELCKWNCWPGEYHRNYCPDRGVGATVWAVERKIRVLYKGTIVGDYLADILVAEAVLVELKVSCDYSPEDEAQLLNELKATGIRVGLLINFGRTKVEFKRLVF
jgi:GxxExxY protein